MTEEVSKTSEKESVEESLPYGAIGQVLSDASFVIKALPADALGNETIEVDTAELIKVSTFLRDSCHFDLLLSCSGVDWSSRLESVYHLYSTVKHQYLVLKVTAKDNHSPSLVSVWPAANWHERETYDLFGIQYDGHPNLERILMPLDWLGHPLRKDYKMNDPRLVWNER